MAKYVYVILNEDVSIQDAESLALVFPNTRIAIRTPYSDNTVYGFHGIPEEDLIDAAANFYNTLNNIKRTRELKDIKIRVLYSVEYNVWVEVTEEIEEIKKEEEKLDKVINKLISWK